MMLLLCYVFCKNSIRPTLAAPAQVLAFANTAHGPTVFRLPLKFNKHHKNHISVALYVAYGA